MKKRILSLVMVMAIIMSFVPIKVVQAATEDELIQKLKSSTSDDIVQTYYDDFDGDGKNELFALVGKISTGIVWYVSENSIEKLEEDYFNASSGESTGKVIEIENGKKCFEYFQTYGNGQSVSIICIVKNNNVNTSKLSGYLSYGENGWYLATSDYDCTIDKEDFNKGVYFGTGRSWKNYWYYFDENINGFKEYGGTEITKEQFCEFNGAEEILSLITTGTIYNILYRENGIININIIEETEIFKNKISYNFSNILVGYDNDSVWVIQDESNYNPNIRAGFYLSAKNPDIATYPEFVLPQTKETQIVDTILDETILKANILHNNDQFHYYKNVFRSPAELLNEEQEKGYTRGLAKTYLFIDDVLNVLTLHLDNGEDLDTSKYYEAVLADILETDSDGVWDNIYSTWKTTNSTYNNKILQAVIGEAKNLDGIKTSEFMKNNDKTVVFDTIIDYSKEQGICKDVTIDVDFFDKLSLAVDLAGDFFDAVNEAYAYTAVQQEKIDVLKDLQSKTDNPYLKSACAALINDIKFAHESTLGYFATNWGKETATDLFEFSHGIVAGLVLQYITTDTAGVTPYAPGLAEAMAIVSGGRFVANALIKADDMSKNILTVSAYASIESEIRKFARKADNAFDKSKTIDNAVTLISYADFMKAAMLQSCDIFNAYVESVKKSAKNQKYMAVIGDVFNGDLRGFLNDISKSDNYDDAFKICDRTKQFIKETDFYSNNGTDIVQYLRKVESTTPSSWAKEYVDIAIEYNILADYMENNYQNNITRAEFCTLMTYTLEAYSGKSIDELMETFDYKTELFEDTYYEFVYYMARLGIVNGVSETEFNPLGEISRQETATMLMRAAKVVNVDISAPSTDLSGVADWAKDGVNFVVDRNIMTGTDNGFEPEGKYTKEQAITTMVRFFENLK